MYRDFHRQESEGNMFGSPRKFEPDEAAAVSILQYMNSEQLQEYLNSADKIDTHINDLPQVKSLKKERENSTVKNRSLAEYNLSQQPQFDELKREVATLYEEVNTLKLSLGKDVAKLESCAGTQSHDTMLAIFQTESATSEEHAEKTAEDFCDGEIDIDTFISEYLPKRTEAHIHKTKVDKMKELIRQQEPVSRAPYPSTAAPPPQTNMKTPGYPSSPGYSNPAPYPSGNQPFGMPSLPTPYYPR